MSDDPDFEPWSNADLADAIRTGTVDSDGRVVRELTRRMAEHIQDVHTPNPKLLTQDLSQALTSLAWIASTVVNEWMADLGDEKRPEGAATILERLVGAAKDFKEISGSF